MGITGYGAPLYPSYVTEDKLQDKLCFLPIYSDQIEKLQHWHLPMWKIVQAMFCPQKVGQT